MTNYRRDPTKLLQEVLETRKISEGALGEIMGVTRATVSRWIQGHTKLSKPEIFFLECLLPGSPISPLDEKPVGPDESDAVLIPIYSNVPGNPDFDKTKDKIGELLIPAWTIGGQRSDFYIMRIPGTADLAIVKPKKTVKPGDYAVIKTDQEFSIQKLDDIHTKFNLEVSGVAVMILKVT